jgi:hypothetical protein
MATSSIAWKNAHRVLGTGSSSLAKPVGGPWLRGAARAWSQHGREPVDRGAAGCGPTKEKTSNLLQGFKNHG